MPRRTRASLCAPVALLTALVCTTACDQVVDALQKGAEAVGEASNAAGGAGGPMSEDDKLGAKLSGYITCINGASSRVRRSADRYTDWVDLDAGVTGKEKNVYGIFDLEIDQSCVDGINNGNAAEPHDEDLEKIAKTWLDAYQAVQPLIHTAHEYYDEDDYKDDDFAKAKTMHEPLVAGIKAFQEADQELRRAVSAQNDALQERRLATIEKEEGRKLHFQNANVMSKAKHLMEMGDVATPEDLDLEKFGEALDSYTKAFDEMETYVKANKEEAGSVTMFSSFVSGADELKKVAKDLKRRKRDNKKFSDFELRNPEMAEGSPAKLSATYNDLVSDSNRLSWSFYEPGA